MKTRSRWRKIPEASYPVAGAFLKSREALCVGACSRFLARSFKPGHIWSLSGVLTGGNDLSGAEGEIAAFLMHSRSSLFPIFTGDRNFPLPRFLGRFLRKVSIYSVQGLIEDTEILEEGISKRGYAITDRIDYDLMTLDKEPLPSCFKMGPPGLLIRTATETDKEGLFPLQSAYDQEEVIPLGGSFDADNCRKNLSKLLASEKMMVACLGNKIVGKINTNAKSFSRYQIGGVYVLPQLRGHGIAAKLSAVFLKELTSQGRGISLFVKKRNAAARNLYRRLGFIISGDYRISYY
jgi:ribosomal protein S18 acetylase RimI-like enzyme